MPSYCVQVAPSYGSAMYGGQPLQPQPQRSSVADMFVASDFTTAAQRLQPGKMFDFDHMRGYLRQQPLPGRHLSRCTGWDKNGTIYCMPDNFTKY